MNETNEEKRSNDVYLRTFYDILLSEWQALHLWDEKNLIVPKDNFYRILYDKVTQALKERWEKIDDSFHIPQEKRGNYRLKKEYKIISNYQEERDLSTPVAWSFILDKLTLVVRYDPDTKFDLSWDNIVKRYDPYRTFDVPRWDKIIIQIDQRYSHHQIITIIVNNYDDKTIDAIVDGYLILFWQSWCGERSLHILLEKLILRNLSFWREPKRWLGHWWYYVRRKYMI